MPKTTSDVRCPGMCGGRCGGEAVTADFGTFRATTVRVAPCSYLLAQGWVGPQQVLRKSEADRLEPAGGRPSVIRHRDGLVGFSA